MSAARTDGSDHNDRQRTTTRRRSGESRMPRKYVSDEMDRLKQMQLASGHNPSLCAVVERNIAALIEVRRQTERTRGMQCRIADAITAFSGSMLFIYLHAAWFGLWILANLGGLGARLV